MSSSSATQYAYTMYLNGVITKNELWKKLQDPDFLLQDFSYKDDEWESPLDAQRRIIGDIFPAVFTMGLKCPARKWLFGMRRCHKHDHLTLGDIIVRLNDGHKWPRELIAEWVESLDLDTTMKAQSKGN